jgi:hypothetical protein
MLILAICSIPLVLLIQPEKARTIDNRQSAVIE